MGDILLQMSETIVRYLNKFRNAIMGSNDTALYHLAYVLNKNCSASDLQIYTSANQENLAIFHFAHACFLLGTIHILHQNITLLGFFEPIHPLSNCRTEHLQKVPTTKIIFVFNLVKVTLCAHWKSTCYLCKWKIK